MPQRRRLGNFGEAAAAAYLSRQGYTLLARQWRCAAGEIDLVAQQDDTLVFVEVRTRRGDTRGIPEESVNATKRARLITLAYTYLTEHALDETQPWRIDVIAIEVDGSGRISRLEHLPNAIEG
jgi:putative endonuclease